MICHITKRSRCRIVNFSRIYYYSITTFYDFLVVNGKRNVRKYALFSVRDTLLRCYQDKVICLVGGDVSGAVRNTSIAALFGLSTFIFDAK